MVAHIVGDSNKEILPVLVQRLFALPPSRKPITASAAKQEYE
jgi:hypothetical protein